MEPLSLSRIAELAGGAVLLQGSGEIVVGEISTDSRTVKTGELFVALHGDNFDAHDFLREVARAGAAGAIVQRDTPPDLPGHFAVLRVPDTLTAYQQLAANYRRTLPLNVLAITGSNGKTSTKDFVASILRQSHPVSKTEGNFNNHVGLPRTILKANRADKFGVWELGMNHPGEIALLAGIAQPDAAIITNIGVAHIEFLGSREAIAREKTTLAEAVPEDGFVVLNADDPFSNGIAAATRARVVLAGIRAGDIRASDLQQKITGSEFTITEGAHRTRAALPVPGLHMVQNALLAVAAGRALGISLEQCAAGLATAPLSKARLHPRTVAGVQFIDDSYNANPDSMKAALRTLLELPGSGRRVAVLGRMFELGSETERSHREVGETAAELGVDHLIVLADETMAQAARAAGLQNSVVARDASEAAEILSDTVAPGDLVLIKGSRSARIELVLEEFARLQPAGGAAR